MPSSRSSRPSSRLARSLALLTLLATAGCSGGSGDAAEGPKPAAKDIRLEAQVSATDKALTIQYTLTNQGSAMVVAFNGIPAQDGTAIPKVDANAVYVTAVDGTVQLSKRVFAQPDDGESAAPLVRGAALVGGESITEKVVVPLPLRGRSPYGAADRKSVTLPDPVKQLQFCVGTALQDQLTSRQPDTADGDTRLAYPHGSATAGKQLVTCAPPVALAS